MVQRFSRMQTTIGMISLHRVEGGTPTDDIDSAVSLGRPTSNEFDSIVEGAGVLEVLCGDWSCNSFSVVCS